MSGKVLPERANVNLPKSVVLKILPGRAIPEGSVVVVAVICSQISIVVHSREEIADLQALAHECEGMCRMIVDCLGFLLTCGYDIEVTQVSSAGGLHVVYGVKPADFRPIPYSDENIQSVFERLLTVPRDYQLQYRRALADYREAIRSHEDTAFFCYRVVEDLRQVFVVDEQGKEAQTWNRLWEALPVAEDTRAYVKDIIRPLATGNRHGGGSSISHELRLEMLEKTSKIIAAFVDWARMPKAAPTA
ncbi:hypothetical protein GTP46_13375 [Duganella sp. FT135W]|uniref:Uncharacterized protein n=1 Tax=Duganella flavida TaxID=2692175 RepID=A0A6L8K953_9BURK|nr:hypothetical protein [Duganella flavida]MYM23640.1 hypothetical protein [Duganella flavida]